MATLDQLKSLLIEAIPKTEPTRQLTDTEYGAGFRILSKGSTSYETFIIPQLSSLLTPFLHSRSHVSILEIGPGPKSVLGDLPSHLRQKIRRYAAFESNVWHAAELESWCETSAPFPGLINSAEVTCATFDLNASQQTERFDLILFCHSMYGMDPKRNYVEKAINMLKEPGGGLVVVFHRDGKLHFDGLTCHKTTSSPTDTVCVQYDLDTIQDFASFIAGRIPQDLYAEKVARFRCFEICQASSISRDVHTATTLEFSSPTVMVVFNQTPPEGESSSSICPRRQLPGPSRIQKLASTVQLYLPCRQKSATFRDV